MPLLPARAARLLSLLFFALLVLSLPACRRGVSSEEKAIRAELRQALRERAYERAIPLAERVVHFAPRDHGAWARLARAQIGAGHFAEARQTLVKWQATTRRPPPKFHELAGDIAMKERDPVRAVQSWLAALSPQPGHVRLLNKLARGYRAQNLPAEEERVLSALLKREENATTLIERALCRRRLHRWSEAIEDYRRAVELAPDDVDVRRGARTFERLGKFLGEIRKLDAQLAMSPNDDQTLADRALLFLRSLDAELALADSERAMSKAPWAVRPKLFRCIALVELGRGEECEAFGADSHARLSAISPELLETISRLDAEISVERENLDLYLQRAWQLNELGQPRLALADAEAALSHQPESVAALSESAYALSKLGRSTEALAQIRRATELDANSATAWQYRGELERELDDCAAAVESLSRALTISPTAALLRQREDCYRQLGMIEKADEDRHALEALR